MNNKKNYIYKERDAGHKELFSMLIYRPLADKLLTGVFKYIDTTPNQISFLSMIIVAAGSYFFAFTRYPYNLVGVLLLHLGYTIDMLDGQYARYKGLTSKFGQWLDPFFDLIKSAFIFISLSYGAYAVEKKPACLIWGMVALTHSLLTYYAINTRSQIRKGHSFEVKLKKNIYVGYEITSYWAVTFIVIFNALYAGLIFMATIGALSWIKVYITLKKYYMKHREEIEKAA